MRIHTTRGFTLVEVLLSVIFLGLLAAGAMSVFSTGFQTMDAQAERLLLDGKLRSRMELLVGTAFSALSDGSEAVTVNGTGFTIDWTATPVDLDGDGIPEPSAKTVTVSVSGLPDRSLTTLLVDHENIIGKIP